MRSPGTSRLHTGTFVTIDPQGAVGCQLRTSAFAINDAGVIVGAYLEFEQRSLRFSAEPMTRKENSG